MAVKKKSRKRGVTVNFSGVESGGRRVPDGEYLAEIVSCELEESSAGNPMLHLQWKVSEGKYSGAKIHENISLVPQALWKLKTLLEVLEIDPQEDDVGAEEYASELMEKSCTIIVRNEMFEGTERPKVTGYGGAEESEAEEEDDEEEEEEPKVRNKRKAKDEEEDEEEDADDSEDEDEDEEEEAPKKKVSVKKGASKIKEGSRVKFDDGDGNIIKGTITSLDDGTATVEDKSGDEYEVPVDQVEPA